jgi:genome maintenance exonuclease 1
MKHVAKFIYPKTVRSTIDGKRVYDIENGKWKLPSVTTVLDATQSEEKRQKLAEWRAREGEAKAEEIRKNSAARGTAMHKILEKYILGEGYMDLTTVGQEAHNMAQRVIEQGLCNVSEYYGSETTLYYPGLYAGQTDLIALHKNDLAVIDFKQTNKPKRREYIEDYCVQLAAYALAHNYVYKTNIQKGVVMMCSKDNFYQEFIIQGLEMKKYMYEFLARVDRFHQEQKEKD